MSDSNKHHSRYVVETIDEPRAPIVTDEVDSQFMELEFLPEPQVLKSWKPGQLKSSLHNKIRAVDALPLEKSRHAEPASDQAFDVMVPNFFQDATENKTPGTAKVASLATIFQDRITKLQLVSMSIPAFLTVALMLSVMSFFAGRFSAGTTKQASADNNPSATIAPSQLQTSNQAAAIMSPDDMIKTVRTEFADDLTLSKKSDETAAEKEQVSKSILHVLDTLTKGINSYPDVASLYFERAQVEKMVMESAPSLKTQAEADYQKSLSLSPLTAAYYIGFADYYDVAAQGSLAIENYKKAVQLDPKNIEALYPLAKLFVAADRLTEARDLYIQVLANLPSSAPQYSQVQQESAALDSKLAAAPVASSSAFPVMPSMTPLATATAAATTP